MMKFASALALTALLGCASTPDERFPSQMEFRTTVHETHPEATPFVFDGATVTLGDPQIFKTQVYHSRDASGNPALGFEVHDQEKAAFGRYTTTLIDKPLAILIDGKVISMPVVDMALPGAGVINGGADGFSYEEVEGLIETLRSR